MYNKYPLSRILHGHVFIHLWCLSEATTYSFIYDALTVPRLSPSPGPAVVGEAPSPHAPQPAAQAAQTEVNNTTYDALEAYLPKIFYIEAWNFIILMNSVCKMK